MRIVGLGLIIALAGCALPESQPSADSSQGIPLVERAATSVRVTRGRQILIVGDSEACAVQLLNDLPKLVASINRSQERPVDSVSVECKSGTTVQHWGSGPLREALNKHPNPDVVIVFLGTNHYSQRTLPPVSSVLDELGPAQCVWVGNTAVHGRNWPINSLLRQAVQPRCTYFDTEAAQIELADGVHPTVKGAEKWIRGVWRVVPSVYEER